MQNGSKRVFLLFRDFLYRPGILFHGVKLVIVAIRAKETLGCSAVIPITLVTLATVLNRHK